MVVYTVLRPEEPADPSPGSGSAIGLGGRGDSDGASVRRRELAVFLRSRRERLSPSELGLVATTRRRTPGLRREEVAQLTGMSVTWYTALEQARDVHPSPQVLNALARTLRLDQDERHHLYRLAGAADNAVVAECNAVSEELHAVLDKLDPYPACVQNGKFDLLAYNSAMRRLITDLDEVPVAQRNCVWLTFAEPRWRERVVDWEQAAARQVANLRVAMAEHVDDGRWKALVSRLRGVVGVRRTVGPALRPRCRRRRAAPDRQPGGWPDDLHRLQHLGRARLDDPAAGAAPRGPPHRRAADQAGRRRRLSPTTCTASRNTPVSG